MLPPAARGLQSRKPPPQFGHVATPAYVKKIQMRQPGEGRRVAVRIAAAVMNAERAMPPAPRAVQRQQETLEPVLETPITREEFLLGKALAVFLPSLFIAYVVFAVFIAVVEVFANGDRYVVDHREALKRGPIRDDRVTRHDIETIGVAVRVGRRPTTEKP